MFLYSKFAALCKRRPKTMAATIFAYGTIVLLVLLANPGTWKLIEKYPVVTAWIVAAALLALPFEIAAIVRKRRGKKTEQED